jgi:hypothetical protein
MLGKYCSPGINLERILHCVQDDRLKRPKFAGSHYVQDDRLKRPKSAGSHYVQVDRLKRTKNRPNAAPKARKIPQIKFVRMSNI